MNLTARALLDERKEVEIRVAIQRLLHRLKPFIRAYPVMENDRMPDHDIVWVEGVDDSAGRQIKAALESSPALWDHALPNDVCVVPRKALEAVGLSSDIIDSFAEMGEAIVQSAALHHLYEQENRR